MSEVSVYDRLHALRALRALARRWGGQLSLADEAGDTGGVLDDDVAREVCELARSASGRVVHARGAVGAPLRLDDRFAGCAIAIAERDEPQLLDRLGDLADSAAAEVVRYWEDHERERVVERRQLGAKFSEIIGNAPTMHEVFALLEKVARSQSTVLIHGESGTGKELIARAIHYHGPRAKKAFVVQNCSALNDNLLESSLFGHARGAFTGAVKDHKGLFEVADGGTFFLDEIGDMSPALQVKLLRVLQEGTMTPVGATKQVKVDVRIIAASHKDLTKLVERGMFREDLFYRVNVLRVDMPPLRERLADLEVLVDHFLRKHHRGEGEPPILSRECMAALRAYHWPGNIRELENEIERLLVLTTGGREVPAELLSQRILDASAHPDVAAVARAGSPRTGSLADIVAQTESSVIAQGLIRTHWNTEQLAADLGIAHADLLDRCKRYGLTRD